MLSRGEGSGAAGLAVIFLLGLIFLFSAFMTLQKHTDACSCFGQWG